MQPARSTLHVVSDADAAREQRIEEGDRPQSGTITTVPAARGAAAVRQIRQALDGYNCTKSRIRLGKFALLTTDLATLWFAFLASRVVGWLTYDITLAESFTVWWQNAGAARISIYGAISVGMVLWFWGVLGHYTRLKPYWDEVREVLIVVAAGSCIDTMLVFLGKWDFSRLWLLTTWGSLLILLPVSRLLIKRWINKHGWLHQPYVIIGCGQEAVEAAAALESEPLMGFRPIALVRSPSARCGSLDCFAIHGRPLPNYMLDEELEEFLKTPSGLHIVVVMDSGSSEELKALAQRLTLERDDVFIVPPINGLPLFGMELSHFFSHEVLLLRARNNLSRNSARIAKRAFDVLGSLAILAAISPFMLAIALMVRRDGGSATYGHVRVGQDGRPFKCLKFRSMVANSAEVLAELLANDPEARREWERDFKLKNDPRITPIGAFLRRTSLDELPQLINVLRGEMSLVGPRPVVKDELQRYGDMVSFYLKVRPGMSGLWQISGRSETDYARRVWLDRWYVQNWSLWYDLVILIRTIRVVLRKEGAY